jgi:hypothetical protein
MQVFVERALTLLFAQVVLAFRLIPGMGAAVHAHGLAEEGPAHSPFVGEATPSVPLR